MSIVKSPPQLLPDVIKAIVDKCEKGGSSASKIIDQIRSRNSDGRPVRNLALQVKRALDHGVSIGILVRRSGNYYINTNAIDPVCKSCHRKIRMESDDASVISRSRSRSQRSATPDEPSDCARCRRKKKQRSKGRRGSSSRSRKSSSYDGGDDGSETQDGGTSDDRSTDHA